MNKYFFKDAKEDNGFFSKIRVDGTHATRKTQFKREDGRIESSRSKPLNGNLLPNMERTVRPAKDIQTNDWVVDATEEQMAEWANILGAKDNQGRLIEKVRFGDESDPFLTGKHCKIKIEDNFLLDDSTTLGKVQLAVLRGRRDFDFGDNDLSQYDMKNTVVYKACKLGAKPDTKSNGDINEKMKFYTALSQCSAERKVMMLERLQVPIEGIPEEAVMNETLDMKYNEEGNMKVGRKNQEMKTNREVIDFMMDLDDENLEELYYIHKAHRFKIFTWNNTFNYYEYTGYNLGRKLDEVETYLQRSENATVLHSIIAEIKGREKNVEELIKKGNGKKKQ